MAKVNSSFSLLAAGAVASGVKTLLDFKDPSEVKVSPLLESTTSFDGKVSIIIADVKSQEINDSIADILNQVGITNFEILVDQQLAISDPRVKCIFDSAQPAPLGWSQITWTCQKLAFAAEGEILVFFNPRLLVANTLLISAINHLIENNFDALFVNPKVKSPLSLNYLYEVGKSLPLFNYSNSSSAISPDLLVIKKNSYNRIAGHTRVATKTDLGVELFGVLQNYDIPTAVCSSGALATIGSDEAKPILPLPFDIAVRFLTYLAPVFVLLFSRSKSLKFLGLLGTALGSSIAYKQLRSFKPVDLQRLALTPLAALVTTIFDLLTWWRKWKA